MKDLSNISVVLPSLDPDEKLHAVIEGLLEYGFTDIILVNDGSKEENLHSAVGVPPSGKAVEIDSPVEVEAACMARSRS